MSWNANFVVLIFITTAVSYASAKIIEKEKDVKKRKTVLILNTIFCLGILFFYKYFNFFSISITKILDLIKININPITINVLLPVGISFYTFQTLGYVIDVYNGKIQAENHFGHYATFVSFFPQLVAGPIERTNNLLPQIKEKHFFDYKQATNGLKLMAWGFFKKMCIADTLAASVDYVYTYLYNNSGFSLLLAVLAFTIQIYCDFSGYSDIAIGSAKLFGINLTTNFKSPYFSSSIKEFWSRWHISLSTWLKDYIYIPLGGSRCSPSCHYLNLLITFFVSGLWHGANWTFVIWGIIHGLGQIIENILAKPLKIIRSNSFGKIASVAATFIFCSFTWIFFRSENVSDSIYVISHMFDGISSGSNYFNSSIGISLSKGLRLLFFCILLFVYDFASLNKDVIEWISAKPLIIRWAVYIIMTMFLFLFSKVGNNSFIYFQF